MQKRFLAIHITNNRVENPEYIKKLLYVKREKNNPGEKWTGKLNRTSQQWYPMGQRTYENFLSLLSNLRNAKESHCETQLHTHPKLKVKRLRTHVLVKMWNMVLSYIVSGVPTSTTVWEHRRHRLWKLEMHYSKTQRISSKVYTQQKCGHKNHVHYLSE